jgi:hypothetical protein
VEALGGLHTLWTAVIALAVRDMEGADETLREDAWRWVFGGDEDFDHVASLLGLEASWVRRQIRARLRRRAQHPRPSTAPQPRG